MKFVVKVGHPRMPLNRDDWEVPLRLIDSDADIIQPGEDCDRVQRVFATALLTFIPDTTRGQIEDMLPGMIEDFKKNVCDAVMAAERLT